MIPLSIVLPEADIKATDVISKKLHISRSEFIRRSVKRELETFYKLEEEERIKDSFTAMKKSDMYLKKVSGLELLDDIEVDDSKWWE